MLRSLPYETKVPTPPADRDWVDYTLFDVQTGYADSLATSMVVMLRTLGIPARVVTGFAPGQFDENEAAYIVYESEAHAWVEVFFPRLGWINFEPSVLRDLPFRPTEDVTIIIPITDGMFAGESPDMYMEDPYFDGFGEFVPFEARPQRHALADRPRRRRPADPGGRGGLVRDDGAAAARPARPAVARPVVRAVHAALPAGPGSPAATRRRRSSTPPGWSAATRAPASWSARSPRSTSRAPTAARSPDRRSWREPRRPGTSVRRPLARRVFLRGVIAARDRFEEIRDDFRERVKRRQARRLTPCRPSSTMPRYDR